MKERELQQTLDLKLTPTACGEGLRPAEPRRFSDSAFEDNKVTGIHRWVPWIAGFSANFVRDMFEHYLPPSSERHCVLEPFAGVGTTLVEGILSGHDVTGFEINPFAFLASKVKCAAHMIRDDAIASAIDSFVAHAIPHISAIDDATATGADPFTATTAPISAPPQNFKSRVPFFSALVEMKLLHCLDAIRAIDDPAVREMFLLAFGSILVSVSNYSYEPSLGSRVAAGRAPVDDDDVAGKLLSKVRGMREDISAYRNIVAKYPSPPSAAVYNESSLGMSRRIPPGSVDIVVTSPPYLNNYHYVRNTRPHLFWLDFVASSSELKGIERASFGTFWQTVRDRPPMPLSFDHPALDKLITVIAERNTNKGVYGGQGWANYATQYFNDCNTICVQLKHVLKEHAHAVFVLGNSIIQGIETPVDKIFGDIAEQNGLELCDIHMLRTKRVGNSVVKSAGRYGEAGGAMLYETAVVVRQPSNR